MNHSPACSSKPRHYWYVTLGAALSLAASCSYAKLESEPEEAQVSAVEAHAVRAEPEDTFAGQWGMTTEMGGSGVAAVMTLVREESGELTGTWESRGQTMDLLSIATEANAIRFEREIPGGQLLSFIGELDGEDLIGAWSGSFGELPSTGSRDSVNPFPDRHFREIVNQDGMALLWANENEEGETEYFDVTDAQIDPVTFQFGIGKDTIPSIDEPVFVSPTDPQLSERGVTEETQVLGVAMNGIARAYPVEIMDMHEVVNDEFSGESFAVMW